MSDSTETRRKRTARTLISSMALLLAACGQRLAGSWVDTDGITTYEFHDDGIVRISALGAHVKADYRVDGDRVVISSPQGALVLTQDDRQLHGPMGLVLVPVPDDVD